MDGKEKEGENKGEGLLGQTEQNISKSFFFLTFLHTS